MLSDPNVRRWYANLKEGSEITADTHLRKLRRYCDLHRTTPQALAQLSPKAAYDLLVDNVAELRANGIAGSAIKNYTKTLKSWFTHNNIIIARKVKISGANKTPTLVNEKTPEPNVLQSLWRFCDHRQAAAVALLAFTGMRPETLGNYRGTDGLRLMDLPEIQIDNGNCKVTFTIIPTKVTVRDGLSKMGNAYETFLCEEGCGKLKAYLEQRMHNGQKLTPQSAVIADGFGAGRAITTKATCKVVRKAFRHAGFPWRPYILRRFFDTRMGQALAKSEIGLLREWVTFWMAHHGDIEAVYRLQKKLPESLLTQMRDAYTRGSHLMLQTEPHQPDAERLRREFRATALGMLGFTEQEIKALNLDKLTTDEMQELIKRKLGIPESASNSRKQLVVSVQEAKDYINNKRWEFKGSMATGRGGYRVAAMRPQAFRRTMNSSRDTWSGWLSIPNRTASP